MSIRKFDEEELKRFNECKTDEDYRGFVRDIGYELSEVELEEVCGGLSGTGTNAALQILSERLKGYADKAAGAISRDGFERYNRDDSARTNRAILKK